MKSFSPKTISIINGKCITPSGIVDDCVVTVQGDRIVFVGTNPNHAALRDAEVIDAAGQFVSPGFIDIQINGGGGSDSLDGTPEAFRQIVDFHSRYGVTNLLLTLVSSGLERTIEVLSSIRQFKDRDILGSFVLGAHLEGPYISPFQSGAHNPKFVRQPGKEDYKKYCEYCDVIKLVTEAPEVPGVLEFCQELIKRGIVASIGHSHALYHDVMKAVESGFSMVTHIYSGMSSMRRVNLDKVAGVLESALLMDNLYVGVVGDGLHVPETLFKLVLKNKGLDKIVLTTDAIRAAGLKDGEYFLGDPDDRHKLIVENGIAKTPDRTLYAGSMATMNKCIRNAARLDGLGIMGAVKMASINPARLLKIDHEVGSLEKEKKADIVLFDGDINVSTVIKGGIVVHKVPESSASKVLSMGEVPSGA